MNEQRLVKANFFMNILNFQKVKDSKEDKIKFIDSKIVRAKGKEFEQSLIEERDKGIHREIQTVYSKPINFQFGIIYIRADGEMVWIYNLIED